jgi:predicted nucleotidyltransferase
VGIDEIVRDKREEILAIAARYGARNVRVFGSVARGDADEASDVDFVVEFDDTSSLMDHAAMLLELEELLGRRVDIAPEKCLRPRVRERVLEEAVPL